MTSTNEKISFSLYVLLVLMLTRGGARTPEINASDGLKGITTIFSSTTLASSSSSTSELTADSSLTSAGSISDPASSANSESINDPLISADGVSTFAGSISSDPEGSISGQVGSFASDTEGPISDLADVSISADQVNAQSADGVSTFAGSISSDPEGSVSGQVGTFASDTEGPISDLADVSISADQVNAQSGTLPFDLLALISDEAFSDQLNAATAVTSTDPANFGSISSNLRKSPRQGVKTIVKKTIKKTSSVVKKSARIVRGLSKTLQGPAASSLPDREWELIEAPTASGAGDSRADCEDVKAEDEDEFEEISDDESDSEDYEIVGNVTK